MGFIWFLWLLMFKNMHSGFTSTMIRAECLLKVNDLIDYNFNMVSVVNLIMFNYDVTACIKSPSTDDYLHFNHCVMTVYRLIKQCYLSF